MKTKFKRRIRVRRLYCELCGMYGWYVDSITTEDLHHDTWEAAMELANQKARAAYSYRLKLGMGG